MEDLHRLEAKGLARAKIRSRRRRVSIVRRRTFRGSLALFAVLWAIIFGQLVTGNDPALSRIRGHSHGQAATTHGAGTTAAPSPGATASTAPPPEPEAEFESGLESEREPGGAERESEAEHASEPQPEPEPVAPIVTTAS